MSSRRLAAADAVLVAVAGTVSLMAGLHIDPGDQHSLDALGWTCVAAAAFALLFRRPYPLSTLVAVMTALVTYGVRDYAGGPIYAVGAIALYSYAVTIDRRRAVGAGLAAAVAVLVARSIAVGGSWLITFGIFGWATIAVLVADAVRSTGERRRMALEHRDAELHRRLAEDRLQIARDLHDSVAHAITVINVQAGVAAHLVRRDPSRAAPALEAITVASRDVLDELGAQLAVLRRDNSDGMAPRSPLPQLNDLHGLITSCAQAGLHVELRLVGDIASVPTTVSTVAYRIIQEALTNVVRHAATDRAALTVEAVDGALSVSVVDDGRATVPFSPGTGRGLTGMHERAETTGGTVIAGRRPEGGFSVRAHWPQPEALPR